MRGMKLVWVALDQPDAARLQHLIEGRWQQRRIDQRQVVGERADHRHQVQAGFLAVPQRQVEAETVMPCGASRLAICWMPASLVRTPRPIASVVRVDPDAVAALDLPRRLDAAENRARRCVYRQPRAAPAPARAAACPWKG